MAAARKLRFHAWVHGVQPRIRLTRSFDQRSHAYLGYSLRLRGSIEVGPKPDPESDPEFKEEFTVGIGKAAQAKHEIGVGDLVTGLCLPVDDPRIDPVDYYKVSQLGVLGETDIPDPEPPFYCTPLQLEQYRERGHRRLSATTYSKRCDGCMYGCKMAVEMIVDHWKPHIRRYRTETFCYGPKSCSIYSPGPNRVVPGRKGMKYVEEDWVDEEETAHRGLEE